MRLIDRTTHNTSVISRYQSSGYQGVLPGQFGYPRSVVIDQRDKNQLLITDSGDDAVRTVDVNSQVAGTFVWSDSLKYIRGITQEEDSGDLFVTVNNVLYRITFVQKTVSLIAGSRIGFWGHKDSTLLDSLLHMPCELILIKSNTLLIADSNSHKLRLVDMNSDQVTTLNVTNSLDFPTSLLLTNNSLYVGQRKKIFQC